MVELTTITKNIPSLALPTPYPKSRYCGLDHGIVALAISHMHLSLLALQWLIYHA